MGRGLLQAHLEAFDKVGAGIADERREGYDKRKRLTKGCARLQNTAGLTGIWF
jgi:hypothetical protein